MVKTWKPFNYHQKGSSYINSIEHNLRVKLNIQTVLIGKNLASSILRRNVCNNV